MKNTKFIWQSGKFIPWDQAKTHILSHALQYGTGVFEGLRSYPSKRGEAIFRIDEHVKRFFHGMKTLGMKVQFTPREMSSAILETVKKNDCSDTYIRPYAYYGYQKIGPNPADSPVEIIIACITLKEYLKKDFISVVVAPLQRISPNSAPVTTKISGMYFNAALASMYAWKHGYDEALVTDSRRYIVEGAAENMYIVKDGTILTPPANNILPGITRDTLFYLAQDLKIPMREKRLRLGDLQRADEVFFSGTAVEIHSIGSVNGKRLSKKNPITRALTAYYMDVVQGNVPKYRKWLTIV